VAKGFTPFPTLDALPEQSEWPAPPFAWRHLRAPTNDVPQPCRIEVDGGKTVDGEMVGLRPAHPEPALSHQSADTDHRAAVCALSAASW
jgi:hypothetical protein